MACFATALNASGWGSPAEPCPLRDETTGQIHVFLEHDESAFKGYRPKV